MHRLAHCISYLAFVVLKHSSLSLWLIQLESTSPLAGSTVTTVPSSWPSHRNREALRSHPLRLRCLVVSSFMFPVQLPQFNTAPEPRARGYGGRDHISAVRNEKRRRSPLRGDDNELALHAAKAFETSSALPERFQLSLGPLARVKRSPERTPSTIQLVRVSPSGRPRRRTLCTRRFRVVALEPSGTWLRALAVFCSQHTYEGLSTIGNEHRLRLQLGCPRNS